MIEGVTMTATWTNRLIEGIYKLRHDIETAIRQADKNIPAPDIAQVLFIQPYTRLANVMETTGASRPTVTRWMRRLAKEGVVDEVKIGRQILFINTALLNLLFDADMEYEAADIK